MDNEQLDSVTEAGGRKVTKFSEAEFRKLPHEVLSDTGANDMRMTPAHRALVASDKTRKTRSTKVTIDGHVFDSKVEGQRYVELLAMQKAGHISNLELQPKFVLQPAFTTPAFNAAGVKKHRPITYTADFRYSGGVGKIVEDVKGKTAPLTQQFVLRWKMAQYQNPGMTFVIVRM